MDQMRELLAAIVESSTDAIIGQNLQGVITSWNPTAECMFGYSREEAIRQPMTLLIPPEQQHEASYILERIARGERVPPFETTRRRRDGSLLHVRVALSPVRDENGQVTAAYAIVRDLNDLRQALDLIKASERRYELLAELTPALIWTCTPGGVCDYLNGQWTSYTGMPPQMLMESRAIHQQLHPHDQEMVAKLWREAQAHGAPLETEVRIRAANGAYRWFKSRAVPQKDAQGKIIKWFGINIDIDAGIQVREAQERQLARLDLLRQVTRAIGERQDAQSIYQATVRRIEDQMPADFSCVCLYERASDALVVVSVVERTGTFDLLHSANRPERLGLETSDLVRCVAGEVVQVPDLAPLRDPLAQYLKGIGMRSMVAAPLQVEHEVFGVLIAARCEPNALTQEDSEFLRQLAEHVALAAHHAQLYEALRRAYNDLRQTQNVVMQQERLRALGQMASGIAHDINNAISPITLYAESLLSHERGLSEEARKYLESIQTAADDVAHTVSRMREFYRSKEPQIVLRPVVLHELIEDVIGLTRAKWYDLAQRRGIVIDVQQELAPDLPLIMGVESEIREALINLVFNAVDALPTGGVVTLRTRRCDWDKGIEPQDSVYVEVADNGVGMDERTLSRCFEPFFTTKGERGTGLGLAMVYGIVERHSADIEVDSTPGQGTTVRLIFSVPAASIPETRSADEAKPNRMRLLVVDDDPVVMQSVRDALSKDGHEVVTANGGQAGIGEFRRAQEADQPFDAVITDLGMPYVDGRAVAAAIKGISPATPLILLTGWGQRLMDEGEVPLNIDYVLSKPPKLRELRATLLKCSADETDNSG